MKVRFLKNLFFALSCFVVASPALGFEDARVMPKGIRSLRFVMLTSQITEKTDSAGSAQPLAKPLERNLTFGDIVKGEKDPLRRSLVGGFFEYGGFALTDSVGQFAGDIKSRVTGFAPVLMYGVTDRLTVAAALPVINAAVGVGLGFRANATGQHFLDSLAESYNNQIPAAQEAGQKINGAIGELNRKLVENGYRPATDWEATGLGDLNLVAKYRLVSAQTWASAATATLVAPTGRRDDPNNLLDRNFGDGQWDVAGAIAFDEPIASSGFVLSQFARYTVQFSGRKDVRMATDSEQIEVPVGNVAFKPGNKFETGASFSFASDSGWSGGLGYTYYTKGSDTYRAGASSNILAEDTSEQSHEASVEFGYLSVPAFLRKEIPVPFDSKFVYKRQLSSVNMPVTDFYQFETALFF
jgi:hypothetical protein